MKRLLAALLLLSAVHHASALTEPLPATRLSIEVRNVATKAESETMYRNRLGSYAKTFNRERVIEVTLRNMGDASTAVLYGVYFIGKATGTKERVKVKGTEKRLTLEQGSAQSFEETSGVIEGKDIKRVTSGYRRTTGATIDGWIVTLRDPASRRLLNCKTSDALMDTLARTPGELEKLPGMDAK